MAIEWMAHHVRRLPSVFLHSIQVRLVITVAYRCRGTTRQVAFGHWSHETPNMLLRSVHDIGVADVHFERYC